MSLLRACFGLMILFILCFNIIKLIKEKECILEATLHSFRKALILENSKNTFAVHSICRSLLSIKKSNKLYATYKRMKLIEIELTK